mgnify:CR=1 FL=1
MEIRILELLNDIKILIMDAKKMNTLNLVLT